MKNILLVVALLFTCSAFVNPTAWAQKLPRSGNTHEIMWLPIPEDPSKSSGIPGFEFNRHFLKYTPKIIWGATRGLSCNKEGIVGYPSVAWCLDYKSSDDGIWRTSVNYKTNDGSIDRLFKIVNGKPLVWVQFDPNTKQAVYVSEGARNYASRHGNNDEVQTANTESAKASTTPADQCASLSGTARKLCEGSGNATPSLANPVNDIVKKGLGGLFK